jgi:toxin ParE1/3/4
VERIVLAVDILEQFPLAGRMVPEHARDDLRELVRAPHRIVYRVLADQIDILLVFRASRQIPELP